MAIFPNALSTRFLDTAIRERPDWEDQRAQYIGTSLLPFRSVEDYELTWDVIQSANHIAGIYAMDGTPIPGDDPEFYQMMSNVINVAASRKLDEQTVMTLREPGELALKSRVLQGKRAKALRMLRRKVRSADNEVDTVVEYLIMHALQGEIVWPPVDNSGSTISGAPPYWGNASFTLDLSFRAAFVQDISTLSGWDSRSGGGYNWKHASADPVLDLEVIRELMTQTTHLPAYGSTLIMSEQVMSWLATRANILYWFKGTTGPATDGGAYSRFIDSVALQNFIKTRLGYNIRLYDAAFTYESNKGSASGQTENYVNFLTPGKMIVIPPGALTPNNAYFATAPISGPNDAYRTGKQTWSEKMTKPPWTWEIGVQLKGFPILKTTQEIGVFDVFS